MTLEIEHVEINAEALEVNNKPPCFKSFINSHNEAYHSPKGPMASFEETIAKQKILELDTKK